MTTNPQYVPSPGMAGAAPAPRQLIGNQATIPGVRAITETQNKAPVLLAVGPEKIGKSTLATTLFGFPTPQHQPLVIAADPTGPDSCLAMGYIVHAIHMNAQPGVRWFDKARSTLDIIEKNRNSILQQYGCLVFDDLSTLTYRMLEDARRTSKNPDPRSHYQLMYTQTNEIWWRLVDLEMPVVVLAWQGEPSQNEGGPVEPAAPDIAGKRYARTIAGRAMHILLMEKRFMGKGAPGADQHGFVRLLHTTPWNNQNGGGRLSHVLPEPMPADLGLVLRLALGMPT